MKINLETIRDLNPCANRFENFLYHYPEFNGDHEDFLSLEKISHDDKLWVLLRLMPRFEVEVFAIDCAVGAANSAASDAAYAAYYAAYNAAYAASDAANAATYAAYNAARAATFAANAASAASAAAYAAERERQLDAICYLINSSEE